MGCNLSNIPKIAHLMWDKSPMSWLQVLTIESFHRLNPDWKIILWLPNQRVEDLGENTYVPDYTAKDYFPLIGQMDYVEIRNVDLNDYGIRTDAHFILCSDQLRQHILYEYGGFYMDFDVLWLKPMSEFANVNCLGETNNPEASVCYHKDTYEWSNIALLLAEPGSAYVKLLIEEQKKIKPPYSHQIYGTDLIDKLFPKWELIYRAFPRIFGVPYKTFYPYDINNLKELYVQNTTLPVEANFAMCVHWFNGHKLSKAYINADTYDQPCSMTTILKALNYTKP